MNKIVPYFSTICNKKIFNIYNHITLYLFAYIRGTFFLNTFLPRRWYSYCRLQPCIGIFFAPFSPRHLFRAPRHIGIFSAPLSPYLPLAAAFRIISPFCCKKNRDFADLTLDKRDSADYLFKRLQFFAGLYYV